MALRAGADDAIPPISSINIPPNTIAKVAWPLGKLKPLGSGPVSHKSGRVRPTISFSRSPARRGTVLSSTTRASTWRPLASRNRNRPAIMTNAAIQLPRLVTARAAVSSQPGRWSCQSSSPSIAQRSPGNVGKAHARTNTAAVPNNAAARQHHLREALLIIGRYYTVSPRVRTRPQMVSFGVGV